MMKKITLFLFFLTATLGFTQNTVTVDVGATWLGYMNWFDNPDDPSPDCGGGYCFGDFWEVADLVADIGQTNITLSPNVNTWSDPDTNYWRDAAGTDGNKIMEANLFVESGTTFNGQDLTFTGETSSFTLGGRYSAEIFIKALDPNNGYADTFVTPRRQTLPASGTFSITATAAELAPGLIVQYGFTITGLNANPADDWGSVVVGPSALGVNDFEAYNFKIYPNPTNDSWTIKTNNERISSIQLYDILGKQVMTLTPNTTEAKIDAFTLSKGLYFAKIATDNGSSSLKLIKN